MKLKNVSYGLIAGWTGLGVLEIWNLVNFDYRVLSTLAILSVASVITLWIRDRK